ncbi:Carbohydrate-binding module family 13 protein [Mycena indigotica]|uniref:Carbohydrate-binding module family 13 protein n=1 Tax=Mycena indigotica TaxID=2126181 RepID=A0A8H6SY79_9AGAR|nr:Carbohydrate-binding module family 13 protein [Mycena indigotica]KAF7307478.1 Carbohydrate-binding module family 13 protein [Mycena indigotica]
MFSKTLITLLPLALGAAAATSRDIGDPQRVVYVIRFLRPWLKISNPVADKGGWSHGCIGAWGDKEGSPVRIDECHDKIWDAGRYWELVFANPSGQEVGPQQVKVYGSKCLEVKGNVDADGTRVQIATCDKNNANPNQHWTSRPDSTLRWGSTNKCLDVLNRDPYYAADLVILPCEDVKRFPTQGWSDHYLEL